MELLKDKKILITGLLSTRSIAYGITQACIREGATLAFTYQNENVKERVQKLVSEFGTFPLYPLDVSSDEQIEAVFDNLKREWGSMNGLMHSIGYAPKGTISGDFINGVNREGAKIALDISSYSFAALAKGARPLMQGQNGSMLTLTYLGAMKAIPNYNLMGVAKAALEAYVRYMASCLGPEAIRVNAIAAGPIKSLAASGIGSFNKIFHHVEHVAPLRRNVTIEEIGNVAAFYFSDLSTAITGEITNVDCGYSSIAVGLDE
jgi:enoyl-[acyl-carrier protein] reductase I